MRRTALRRTGLATALIMLSSGLTSGSSAAAPPAADPEVDFAVSPSRLELRTPPGGHVEVDITVYNRDADILVLDAYVEDIESPTHELIAPDELAFTASRWVEFRADQLVVPPGAEAAVTLVADIPTDTPIGGYHAFGFLQSRPAAGPEGILPSGRVGVTLLVEVAPDGVEIDRGARVSDSGLAVRWNSLFDPEVVAHTVVDNTGDAHVVVGGVHTYRAWPGSGGADVKIGPHTTLRGVRHSFETSWDGVPLIGKVTVTSEVVYQVGPDELPVIITQHSVWIIPWHLIGPALVLSVVAAFFIRRRRVASRRAHIEEPEPHDARNEDLVSTS